MPYESFQSACPPPQDPPPASTVIKTLPGAQLAPRAMKAPPTIFIQPAKAMPAYPTQRRTSIEDITAAYRHRYATYLAATFNISQNAAEVEANFQLAQRRPSTCSEAEIR
ncbi:hypothetical protein EV356DRAFT_107690 [Viridothelium virens]|uniref:Uncharacterized protein n=1 Tax=Viridothelium virens TaxID=1048519 RepID=A0A6A6HPG8_VIRVR|nr:hypothetical protein EV356DRAFT_107690 [Viridothelium virens]